MGFLSFHNLSEIWGFSVKILKYFKVSHTREYINGGSYPFLSCSIPGDIIVILYYFQYRYEYSNIIKVWGFFSYFFILQDFVYSCRSFFSLFINICKYIYVNTWKELCLKGQYFRSISNIYKV